MSVADRANTGKSLVSIGHVRMTRYSEAIGAAYQRCAFEVRMPESAPQFTCTSTAIPTATVRLHVYGEVTVQLECHGRSVIGRGASTDVVEASAKAFVDGLNRLV